MNALLPAAFLLAALAFPLSAQPTTAIPSDANAKAFPQWFAASARRVEEAKGKQIDTIFLGDALTEEWLRPDGGLPLWKQSYADRALNFGLAGDGTEHLLWRMTQIDLSPFAPPIRNVVILIGTNDTVHPPEAIVEGIQAVQARSRLLFPQARTLLVGLPHNARADKTTQAVNAALQTLADGKETFYVDLPGKMTPDREGKTWQGLAPDRFHLSPEGYKMWSEAMDGMLGK
ncbi:GDSL-type esterase/lipase family protein [Verrucomicrobium sp. GAS474]|uniref:GDSL-type esterase/lipase family protein n=1 Tax=Verrucomicrobium sp. GAS474 TaxID=1882831 RepID=UPI0012FF976F|nr:GDSL-type esterase/lipase family protein [Verrucomicrobium sp. GAS474]